MKRGMILILLVLLMLTGCSKDGKETKVVLTTGFSKDEVFRIETMSCTLPEIMVYLTNTQNQYESVYGKQIWNTDLDGITLEENVKDIVLAKIAQVKTMNLLAEKYEVWLSEEEKALVNSAAESYFNSLNETEKELMGVNQKIIQQLYLEYALAEKVYAYIIKDINPEISDDEARTITVSHIFLKTYSLDSQGRQVNYSEEMKQEIYRKAQEILVMAREPGQDFEALIEKYSEDSTGTYSFGKGEIGDEFEQAAFELETDEISEVIETEFGYHIIKCLNTFDREETDANKLKIVEQRRKEVFGQEYDEFVSTLTRSLNEKLWEKVSLLHDENVTTTTFFDVYTEKVDIFQ